MGFEKADGKVEKGGDGYENDKCPEPGGETCGNSHAGEEGEIARKA